MVLKIKPDQIVNFNDFNKPINNDDDEDDAWR